MADLQNKFPMPEVPADPVEALRAGTAALRFARECFVAGGAERTANRVRDALSSALGAVRNGENKAVRNG